MIDIKITEAQCKSLLKMLGRLSRKTERELLELTEEDSKEITIFWSNLTEEFIKKDWRYD
jgi:hypothetical protein